MKNRLKTFQNSPKSFWQRRENLGRRGEALACRFLQKRGYTIIAQRFRTRLGEIDIIAKKQRSLAFVEVKTRQGERFGPPLMAITPAKQQRLLRAAHAYLNQLGNTAADYRYEFLAIGIQLSGPKPHIECVPLGT